MDNIIFGAIPSRHDTRDFKYQQRKVNLKESVDLREWDSRIEDQGSLGSCVGNAIASAYELMVRRLYPSQFTELSRLFVYYNSRLFDDSLKEDVGTFIRDGLKAVARYGICSEQLWPYSLDKFDDQPTPSSYVDAAQRLVTKYETLYSLSDIFEVLNDNRPVVIGMILYEGFMELNATNNIVRMPYGREDSIGNHAVVLVGYDLSKKLFLAKNSFGKTWGDNGYFWIPFDYFADNVFERWCFDISDQGTVF